MPGKAPDGTAVVFDFGGVLLHWDPVRLFGRLLGRPEAEVKAVLDEIEFYEWNLELDRGAPLARALEELETRHPRYASVIRAYDRRWEETIVGPVPGSVDILSALRDAGCPLYGLSNWSVETFRRVRPRYPFFDWFRHIVLSGEVGFVKPDPKIFGLLLERIGRPARECVLVDDSTVNVAVATNLGFRAIRFTTAQALADELKGQGLLPA